jgi:hypothetical protein
MISACVAPLGRMDIATAPTVLSLLQSATPCIRSNRFCTIRLALSLYDGSVNYDGPVKRKKYLKKKLFNASRPVN